MFYKNITADDHIQDVADRARKLVDGSKFEGRRPEISEILKRSSTS
jgi:hypothetical protein